MFEAIWTRAEAEHRPLQFMFSCRHPTSQGELKEGCAAGSMSKVVTNERVVRETVRVSVRPLAAKATGETKHSCWAGVAPLASFASLGLNFLF